MNEVCGEILADAGRLISSDRAEQHGDMRANHENIANLWAAYLGTPVSAHDVALMMSLLKIARTKTGQHNQDDYVDAVGYMSIAASLAN